MDPNGVVSKLPGRKLSKNNLDNSMLEQLDWQMFILIASAVLLLLFLLILRRWYRRDARSRFRRWLKRHSRALLENVALSDGTGAILVVDFLVLFDDRVVALDYRDFEGLLFAGDKTEQWTQVLGRHSYRFANPLYELRDKATLLTKRLDPLGVEGYVVFSDAGRFPKGKPERVITQSQAIGEVLPQVKINKKAPLPAAWLALSQADEIKHLSQVGEESLS